LKFCISKNSVFQDKEIFSKKSTKNHQKKFAGLRPAPPSYGAVPLQNVWPQWCWITKTVHFASKAQSKILRKLDQKHA